MIHHFSFLRNFYHFIETKCPSINQEWIFSFVVILSLPGFALCFCFRVPVGFLVI